MTFKVGGLAMRVRYNCCPRRLGKAFEIAEIYTISEPTWVQCAACWREHLVSNMAVLVSKDGEKYNAATCIPIDNLDSEDVVNETKELEHT